MLLMIFLFTNLKKSLNTSDIQASQLFNNFTMFAPRAFLL